MTINHVLAENCCLYYNAGTYAVPTWTLIENIKDVSLSLEGSAVDVSTRASGGWTENVQGLLTSTIEFNILWNRGSGDAAFTAIQSAFFNKTGIEMLVLDGAYDATDGDSQGLRATMMVSNFSRSETLGEAVSADVSMAPVLNSNAHPVWWTQS
jgi:hypothetical protein